MYSTLISAAQLQQLRTSQRPHMVFDCSFELQHTGAGLAHYLGGHIPGAVYADLEKNLSAPHRPSNLAASPVEQAASGGRHPLPSRAQFAAWLASVGFANGMQAVVYDRNRANYCGRLWWMLKWVGVPSVAVLDGGLQAWQAHSPEPLALGNEPGQSPSHFTLEPAQATLVSAQQVAAQLGQPAQTLIDARASARYRGETEPLDPVAGHIPGALNRPFSDNLDANGQFKPAAQLRQEFQTLLAGRNPASVVHHCGSGVSALPNLLAMEIAGLGPSALFAGSWSEWCSDPKRPCAQG